MEMDIGVFAPCMFFWLARSAARAHPALLCAPRPDRFSDSLKQSLFLQRLSKAGHKPWFVLVQRDVVVCGNQDRWNCYAVAYEMLLQFQTVHLGHLEIDNQTLGKTSWQYREQFLSGYKSSRMK